VFPDGACQSRIRCDLEQGLLFQPERCGQLSGLARGGDLFSHHDLPQILVAEGKIILTVEFF